MHTRSLDDLKLSLSELAQHDSLNQIKNALGEDAELYLVGGTVRDYLLGVEAIDFDLATNLIPQVCSERLATQNIKVVETGLRHGTISAIFGKSNIEITTFRKPNDSKPDAYSDCIEIDLSARDFTINSIAFCLKTLEFVDPYAGIQDLKNNLLRCVGSASDRFKEDPLRILRMIRFGVGAGRESSADTVQAAAELAGTLASVSAERIKVEIDKILCSVAPANAFRQMADLNILEFTIPELIPCIGFEQNDFHVHDVFEHTLAVIERCPQNDLTLRLTALYHDLGKPATLSVGEDGQRHFYRHEIESERMCQKRMRELKYSKRETKQITRLVRYHMRPLECGPAGARRLMRDLEDDFEIWQDFKLADKPPVMSEQEFATRLEEFKTLIKAEKERLEHTGSELAINGDDLIQLGLKPGKSLGSILKKLEEYIIQTPELNSREKLIELAQKLISEQV